MVDYNACITVEEAKRILEIVKRHYPGVFDGVIVRYGPFYCYNSRTHSIHLEKDIIEDDMRQCEAIIDHVNKYYGLNLEKNKRTMSIHAFLHELGHCADLVYRKAQGRYTMYVEHEEEERMVFDTKASAYYSMRRECEELREEANFNPDLSMDEREEMMSEAADIEAVMKEVESELDYEYRMICTEVAADKFCADLLKGMFRNYK